MYKNFTAKFIQNFSTLQCIHVDPIESQTDQRAKKELSDSLGLVDFAIRLANSVFNLSDRQVVFLRNSNNTEEL